MSKTKWYAKPIRRCELKLRAKRRGSVAILVALALVLSLGIVAVPMAGTVEADEGNTLEVSKWTEYSTNPIFDPEAKAYYPTVVKVSEGDYRMWYGSNSGVGYATSPDGLHWTEVQNPVTGLTNANHPHVEHVGDNFIIWYWDTSQLYSINAIRYAESANGGNWTGDQPLTQVGSTVIASSGWNRGTYGPCDVLYNPAGSDTIVGPVDAGNVWANKFVMYYDGTTGGDEAIGLAVSADGKLWHGYNSGVAPVLAGGGSGDWDEKYASRCTVLKNDDTYHMWYSGGTGAMNHGIGYATSSDGLTWTKAETNPIFHKTDGVLWRADRTYCPMVIEDGGVYKMWFSGKDTEGNYAIGYATADGPFPSIQSAIDAASAEDTINVAAGTYQEAITIDKSLTLMAASKPVIDCSDRVALGLAQADGCIEVTADNVIIQGFKLIGYDPTGEGWEDQKSSSKFSTIKVTGADGLKVKYNEFTGTSKAAVGLLVDEDCDNVEFTGNTVTDYLQGVAGHKSVDNLLVEGNTFTIPIAENTALDHDQAYGYGVQLWHGNNLQVINNTFAGSWDTVTGDYEDPDALCNHYAVSTFTTYFADAYGWPDIVGDIHIKDNEMTNLYLGVGSFAGGGEIEDNKGIHDNLLGIQLGQVSGTWATAPTAGLLIMGNDIENNKRGIWAQSFVADGIAAHFNNIVGNTEYGVINEDPENDAFDVLYNWWGDASGPTHASNTFNVGSQGDLVSDNVDFVPWLDAVHPGGTSFAPVENADTGEQFSSIQAAIDDAATVAGNTINVAAGTYNEQVVIDKQLTLNGANADVNAVTGDRGSESIIDGGASTAITISADGVIVDGFTLDGGITLDDTANPISGGTISNNIITGADNPKDPPKAQNGIRLGWDTGLGVDGVTIENNTIINSLEKGIRFASPKLGDGGGTASNITISGNEIKDNGSAGMETYGPGLNTIINNIISGNDGNGINLKFDDGDVVTGNTITNNTGPGITLRQVTNTVVENNSVSGHLSEVVIGTCETVPGGKGSGIHIFDTSKNNTIRFNDISGNNYGIFIHSKGDLQPSANSINFNNIAGNINYGMLNALVDPPAPVDAENNWWGTKAKGKIKTKMVSGSVDYDPWIGAGVANAKSKKTGPGKATVNAKTEVDTEVDKSGKGKPTITVVKYSHNPGTGFSGDTSKYIDVHIDDPTDVDELTIKLHYTDDEVAGLVESSLRLRWWNDTDWVACSPDSGVNTTDIDDYSGYMWAKITDTSTPSLSDLVGAPFGGGGVPPTPDISVDPASINFGNVTEGTSSSLQTVTVSNDGTANLVVGTIIKGGTNPGQFSITEDSCSGATIAPEGSATLKVVFSPTSTGAKSATLSIPSNDPDESTVTVPLGGTGVSAPPPPPPPPPPGTPPSVTTNEASDITTTEATLNGSLDSLGTASSVGVRFEWGTTSGSLDNKTTHQTMSAIGTFNSSLSDLDPDTTYYFRAKAVGDGIRYGNEKSFTTEAFPPPPPPPPVTLQSIFALPESVELKVNDTQAITVTATYDDESTADVTATSTYDSDDETVTTVSSVGVITGVAEGSAIITVSYTENVVTGTDTVSVVVIPEVIEDQLAPIEDELQMVYYFDNATKEWSYYWPDVGGDLDVLVSSSPYWINVSADCTIDSTLLYAGWNLTVW